MENIKTVTVKEYLETVADNLGRISVPVELANDIARPIWEAVQDIRKCTAAMRDPDEVPEEEKKDGAEDGEGNGICG